MEQLPEKFSTTAEHPLGTAALARDRALLHRWRDGDAEAGVELLGHYRGLFHRTCVRFSVRREDQIQEVYQELVLGLLERLRDLPERVISSFGGYLAWQVRGAIARWRGQSGVAEVASEEFVDARAREGCDAFEAIEAIDKCRGKLPPVERRIFELRYLQNLSLKLTAEELQSNVNAVGQAIFRLSRRMRECLERSGFAGVGRGRSAVEPESHKPESHKPESHKPESHKPESHKPESYEPSPKAEQTGPPERSES